MGTKKRKQDSGEETGGNLIQLMTVSLFIILLAFFILLNSIAVLDEQKTRSAIGSLLSSFGSADGGAGGYSVIEGTGDQPVLAKISTDTGQIDFSELLMESANMDQDIHIVSIKKGTIIRLPASALFLESGIDVIPKGYVLLDKLCSILRKNNLPIEISGHTDDVPIDRQKYFSNRELSSLRAMSILNYFADKGKVLPNRMTAFGWGRYRPVFSNKTRETRKMNRRVDIFLRHNKPSGKPMGGYTFKGFFFNTFE